MGFTGPGVHASAEKMVAGEPTNHRAGLYPLEGQQHERQGEMIASWRAPRVVDVAERSGRNVRGTVSLQNVPAV